MMRTFLYFATCSGQLGSRKHFAKLHSHFKNAHLMEPLYTVGVGVGALFPLELEAYYQFGSCDQENE